MAARLEVFFLREWQRGSAWQILLQPLSWLFVFLTAIRRLCYRIGLMRTHRLRVPVVVVGNISVGGTGKTPLVLALAQRLGQLGRHPAIVTRGYAKQGADLTAREVKAAHSATGERSNEDAESDEATLLSERSGVPVYAGRDRVNTAGLMLDQQPGVDVILSDDGLQHYALGRELEIAVVDVTRGFGNGARLPAGPLRESRKRLTDVDCIVLNCPGAAAGTESLQHDGSSDSESEVGAKRLRTQLATEAMGTPVFEMHYGSETFFPIAQFGRSAQGSGVNAGLTTTEFLGQMQGRRVAAVAGIGNPQRFFSHLRRLGVELVETRDFPDHHAFSSGDLEAIDAEVILMTEKDAVKCRQFDDSRGWMMRIDAHLPDDFLDFVLKKLAHVARSKAA